MKPYLVRFKANQALACPVTLLYKRCFCTTTRFTICVCDTLDGVLPPVPPARPFSVQGLARRSVSAISCCNSCCSSLLYRSIFQKISASISEQSPPLARANTVPLAAQTLPLAQAERHRRRLSLLHRRLYIAAPPPPLAAPAPPPPPPSALPPHSALPPPSVRHYRLLRHYRLTRRHRRRLTRRHRLTRRCRSPSHHQQRPLCQQQPPSGGAARLTTAFNASFSSCMCSNCALDVLSTTP